MVHGFRVGADEVAVSVHNILGYNKIIHPEHDYEVRAGGVHSMEDGKLSTAVNSASY